VVTWRCDQGCDDDDDVLFPPLGFSLTQCTDGREISQTENAKKYVKKENKWVSNINFKTRYYLKYN